MRTATLLTSLTLAASLGCSPFLVPRPPDRATWNDSPPPTCETRAWPVAVDLTIAAAALTGATLAAYDVDAANDPVYGGFASLFVMGYTFTGIGFGFSSLHGYARNARCRELQGR